MSSSPWRVVGHRVSITRLFLPEETPETADGTTARALEKATPPDGRFIAISAGCAHNCGVATDGSVFCWGQDLRGESSPSEGEFVSVSVGFQHHTCGLRTDGTVACWGDDESGQATPPEGEFISVDAGAYHTCGVRIDGSAACWGDDSSGQASLPSAP